MIGGDFYFDFWYPEDKKVFTKLCPTNNVHSCKKHVHYEKEIDWQTSRSNMSGMSTTSEYNNFSESLAPNQFELIRTARSAVLKNRAEPGFFLRR